MADIVVAFDLGSSQIKAGLYYADGRLAGLASAPVPAEALVAGEIAFAAERYLDAACQVMREVITRSGYSPAVIRAVAVTNQRATIIPTDAQGRAIGLAYSWQDMRGDSLLERLLRDFGADRFSRITGLPPSAVWSISKLLWLRANDPAQFAAAAHFVLLHDLLARRLGSDEFVTDFSNASLTGLLDVRTLTWDAELLAAVGISAAQLPRLQHAGSPAGTVSAAGATASGIPAGTPIIVGGGDQQCAALGVGAVEPGDSVLCLGTAAVLTCPIAAPVISAERQVACTVHVVPAQWVLEGIHNGFGSSLRWASQLLQLNGTAALEELAATSTPGARGVTFLPFLAGIGSPDFDAEARGALMGLDLVQQPADVARAVVEGNVLEVRRIIEAMAASVPVREISLVCGGSVRGLLSQALADLSGRPLQVREVKEATALGAALLAWVGVGRFADPCAGARAWKSPVSGQVEVRMPATEREVIFARYCRWVDAVRAGTHPQGGQSD